MATGTYSPLRPTTSPPVTTGVIPPNTYVSDDDRYIGIGVAAPQSVHNVIMSAIDARTRSIRQPVRSAPGQLTVMAIPSGSWTPSKLQDEIRRLPGCSTAVVTVIQFSETERGFFEGLLADPFGTIVGRPAAWAAGAGAGAVARSPAAPAVQQAGTALESVGETVTFWAKWGPILGVVAVLIGIGLVLWILVKGVQLLASPTVGAAARNVGAVKGAVK